MGAVKKELRKEQGNNRKLLQNIEALRVAGMRSEAAIDDLQQRLSATAAAAAASAGAGGGNATVSSGNLRAAMRGEASGAAGAYGAVSSSGGGGTGGGSGMGIALGMGMGGGTGNAAVNASSLTRPSFMMGAAMDGGRGGPSSAGGASSVGGHGAGGGAGPRSYVPAPIGSYNSGAPLSAGSAVGSYGSSMAGSLKTSSRLVSQHSIGTLPHAALPHGSSVAPLTAAGAGRAESPAMAVPVSEAQPHDRRGKAGRGSSADGAFPDDI